VVVVSASIAALIWLCIYETTHRLGYAFAGVALLAASSRYVHLLVEFTANLVGLACLLLFLYLYLRKPLTLVHAGVCAVLLWTCHRAMVPFWIGVVVVRLCLVRARQQPLPFRRVEWIVIALPALSVTILALKVWLASSGGNHRLARFLAEWVIVPWSGILTDQPFLWQQLLVTAASAALIYAHLGPPSRDREDHHAYTITSIGIVTTLLTANPWGRYTGSMELYGERLAICGAALAPILCGYAIYSLRLVPSSAAALTVCALFVVNIGSPPKVATASWTDTRGMITRRICAERHRLPSGQPFIVAQHGYQFALTAQCGLASASRPPTLRRDDRGIFYLLHVQATEGRPPHAVSIGEQWALVEQEALRQFVRSASMETITRLETSSLVLLPR
jgi:hypothetical protein